MSFFITPFFKYIDNTQQNFTPYDLFCLNSKIMNYLNVHFKDKYEYIGTRLSETILNNKIYQIVYLNKEGEDLHVDNETFHQIDKFIKEQNNNLCLLLTSDIEIRDDFNDKIDNKWIMHMIPILDINTAIYGNYLIEEGIGNLYLNLKDQYRYQQIYNETLDDVINQLKKMYRQGYTLGSMNVDEELWQLQKVTNNINKLNIYKPNWLNTNLTFGKPTNFLREIFRTDNTDKIIKFRIQSDKLVSRYFISLKLQNMNKTFNFVDNDVFIYPVSSYKEASELSTVISEESNKQGKITWVRNMNLEIANFYKNRMILLSSKSLLYPPLNYIDDDVQNPYVSIMLIENDEDSFSIQKMIRD